VYQGEDITDHYTDILFTLTDGSDLFTYDITVKHKDTTPQDDKNLYIHGLSLRQLITSSLAYIRPDLAKSCMKNEDQTETDEKKFDQTECTKQENQRKAESAIQEISRVTVVIPNSMIRSSELYLIKKVQITNNCTPAPSWELEVFLRCGEHLHGSFRITEPNNPANYDGMRKTLKGYHDYPTGFLDKYNCEDPLDHIIDSVEIDDTHYRGRSFRPLASLTDIPLYPHDDEPIDFGPFEESAQKVFERGLLPEPGSGDPSDRRRWHLQPAEAPQPDGRLELHARLPDDCQGPFLTYQRIYDESAHSHPKHRCFWLPHFDGDGLYYPVKFGNVEPHRRPLDSLQLLRNMTIHLHEHADGIRYFSGRLEGDSDADGLQCITFGNIPVDRVPDEGNGNYRGPTLNINRFNVGPRQKMQEYNPVFEPFENDHPLYAFVLGQKGAGRNLLIENTAFGIEQLHFQWRGCRLHVWIISFERVLPVYHAHLDLSHNQELYRLMRPV